MILLLADKGVVCVGKIKALVGINTIARQRTE